LKLRALFLFCLAAFAVGAPAKKAEIAERIRLEVERIAEARSAYISAQRNHAESLARIDAQILKLEDDRRRLLVEVARDRKWVADLEQGVAADREKAREAKAAFDAHTSLVLPAAERMAIRIRRGIPYEREKRAARFDDVRKTPAARALQDFWAAVAEELRLLKTRQLGNRMIDVGEGRTKHAYVARLGLANEFFVSEDGEVVGIAAHAPGRPWRFLEEPVARQRVLGALRVLQQRRAPGIERLPFVVVGDRP
jgi:hypothetical protein